MRKELFRKVRTYLRELYLLWSESTVKLLPAHLAFFAVLSIIPILIILYFAAQLFSIPIDTIVSSTKAIIPDAAFDVLAPTEERASGLGIGFWMVVALFVGSNGVNAIIRGANSLYGFQPMNFVFSRGKACIVTIVLLVLILSGIGIIAAGEYVVSGITSNLLGSLVGFRWLLIALLALVAIKYLYIVTPRKRIPSKYTNHGSLFTFIGWLIATLGYSFYFSHFSNYDAIFGSLANMIVLMIWIYLLSTVFVIGMLVNIHHYRALNNLC